MPMKVGKLNNYGLCCIRITGDVYDLPLYPFPVDFKEYFLWDYFVDNRIVKIDLYENSIEKILQKRYTVF